ncbi:MAG: helix-turn-helix domain-containing protein [Clostridiales bacterium]|nr:helix-turn-helix domain-containing protein [Clostridiales bacterium]
MYLNQHTLAKISSVFSLLSMPALLLDTDGQVILPEDYHKQLLLPEQLLASPHEPFINGAFTLIGTTDPEPMYLCFSGNSEEVISIAKICSQLISSILRELSQDSGRETTIRRILDGEIDASDILVVANDQQLKIEAERCVLYAQFSSVPAESLIGILKDAFSENEGDYVFEVGRHAIAIVKEFNDDLEPGEIEQYAMALCSTLTTEADQSALIGIGGVKHSLIQLHESLIEAKKAINIGLPFRPKQQIFNYSGMVLERFLYDIPEDSAVQFHQTLFNKKTAKLFSEEMLNTIEAFFDNSLNLSETARKLYIHRNTLVYRLDKIQKITGLDLRTFDDAMTFKLLMLMGKLRKDKKQRY